MLRQRALLAAIAVLMLSLASSAQSVAVDTAKSKVIVRVFRAGLFGGLGDDHEIVAPVRSGKIDAAERSVELHFDSKEMKVLDPNLSPDKRGDVQQTMLSSKVLDAERYSDIHFVSRTVTPSSEGGYRVEGELMLHGVSRPVVVPVTVADGRYVGATKLKQTDFGIKPVKLFGGTVKVKNEIEISFEVFPQTSTANAADATAARELQHPAP